MRLKQGIYYDGIGSDGSHRFYAFIKDPEVGEYIERFKTYGYTKSNSIKQANRYFNRFSISI